MLAVTAAARPVVISASTSHPSRTTSAPKAPILSIFNDAKAKMSAIAPKLCTLGAAALIAMSPVFDAAANEKVAEFGTSGFIPVPGVFRDTVQVYALPDPGVDGVTLYYTDYSRSLVEKLSNDPFADPSQSSVTCVATGPVRLKDPDNVGGPEGQEIFSELKTLNIFQNKRLRLRRIVDPSNGSIIYISYSTRFTSSADEGGVSSSRYRTSICAVPISK